MSSLKKKIMIMCIPALVFMALACSSSNSDVNFDAQEAVHTAGWLPAGHVAPAGSDLNSCKSCHGEDLLGGISKVSCISCHLGGPLAVHPATFDGFPWFQSGGATQGHGLYVVTNGSASCKNIWCHGTNLQGVPQSAPACSTCHPGEAF